ALFDDPCWEALSPHGPLRRWRLVEIGQLPGQPLTASALRADERIVSYVKGLNALDDRLLPFVQPLALGRDDTELPPSHAQIVDAVRDRLNSAPPGTLPVVQLCGATSRCKAGIAANVAAALGYHLYRLPAAALPTAPGDIESLARLWQRE